MDGLDDDAAVGLKPDFVAGFDLRVGFAEGQGLELAGSDTFLAQLCRNALGTFLGKLAVIRFGPDRIGMTGDRQCLRAVQVDASCEGIELVLIVPLSNVYNAVEEVELAVAGRRMKRCGKGFLRAYVSS